MRALIFSLCLLFLTPVLAEAEARDWNKVTWYRMHFGLGSGEKAVTGEQFEKFRTDYIEKTFPAGNTTTSGTGQWNEGGQGVARETTMVVNLYLPSTPETETSIFQLVEDYMTLFPESNSAVFLVRAAEAESLLVFKKN